MNNKLFREKQIRKELNDIYDALANAGDEMGISSLVVEVAVKRAESLEKLLKKNEKIK